MDPRDVPLVMKMVGPLYRVQEDFNAADGPESGEIVVANGEIVAIADFAHGSDGWVLATTASGAEGFIPQDFVKAVNPLYRVLYDFSPVDAGEGGDTSQIFVANGDIVEIKDFEHGENGWVCARTFTPDATGFIPQHFVEPIGEAYEVLQDFEAPSFDDALAVKIGDRVTIPHFEAGKAGWVIATMMGKSGYIPQSVIEAAAGATTAAEAEAEAEAAAAAAAAKSPLTPGPAAEDSHLLSAVRHDAAGTGGGGTTGGRGFGASSVPQAATSAAAPAPPPTVATAEDGDVLLEASATLQAEKAEILQEIAKGANDASIALYHASAALQADRDVVLAAACPRCRGAGW